MVMSRSQLDESSKKSRVASPLGWHRCGAVWQRLVVSGPWPMSGQALGPCQVVVRGDECISITAYAEDSHLIVLSVSLFQAKSEIALFSKFLLEAPARSPQSAWHRKSRWRRWGRPCCQSNSSSTDGSSSARQCPRRSAWTLTSGRTWCWSPGWGGGLSRIFKEKTKPGWGWLLRCPRWQDSSGLLSCRHCRAPAKGSSSPFLQKTSAFWGLQWSTIPNRKVVW